MNEIELRKHIDPSGRCYLFRRDNGGQEFEVRKRGMWGNQDEAKFGALVDAYMAKLKLGGHSVSCR